MIVVATFSFELSDEALAEKVVKSLKSDIEKTSNFFERSNLTIKAQANKIELEIKASDLTAAKASINSCLYWIENSVNILEKYNIPIKEQQKSSE
jgi:tRNA threonylcarbamoyladenosine modification (KEOPS) complex  Pcc1 subunit